MIDRYNFRGIKINKLQQYEKIFEDRNLSFINHYTTAEFVFPSIEDYKKIKTVKHIWSTGDRFYKLAHKYYDDPQDWWVIAKFNNKPTESHAQIGDIIYIPVPVHQALNYLKG